MRKSYFLAAGLLITTTSCTEYHARSALDMELGRPATVRLSCGQTVVASNVRRRVDKRDATLLLVARGKRYELPERAVTSLEMTSRSEGVVQGILLGGLTGLGLGLGIAAESQGDTSRDEFTGNVGLMAASGVALGVIFGVLVGYGEGSKHVYRYRHPPPPCATAYELGPTEAQRAAGGQGDAALRAAP